MAWEVTFFKASTTAPTTRLRLQPAAARQLHQGDVRVYTIAGLYEFSIYPTRRLGIGIRAGGGLSFTPLLMDEGEYETTVVKEWNNTRPTVRPGTPS